MTEPKTTQVEELTVDNSVVSFDEPVLVEESVIADEPVQETPALQEETNKDKRIDHQGIRIELIGHIGTY